MLLGFRNNSGSLWWRLQRNKGMFPAVEDRSAASLMLIIIDGIASGTRGDHTMELEMRTEITTTKLSATAKTS